MLIGLEYVIAAYGIWMITFFVYIFLTKHRLKTTIHAISTLKQRVSGISSRTQDRNNI